MQTEDLQNIAGIVYLSPALESGPILRWLKLPRYRFRRRTAKCWSYFWVQLPEAVNIGIYNTPEAGALISV
jgi:hypothetical protein